MPGIVKGINALLLLLLFLVSVVSFGQELSVQQIDEMLKKEIPKIKEQGNIPEALTLAEKALKGAIDINYDEGIKQGYLSVIRILNVMGRHKESLEYLDIVSETITAHDDIVLKSSIKAEYGRNYLALGLHGQALNIWDMALKGLLSEKKPKANEEYMTSYIYACKSVLFEKINDTLGLVTNLQRAYAIFPNPLLASRLAKYYIVYRQNMDSAAHFLHLADSLYDNGTFVIHEKAILLRNKARFFEAKAQFRQAIQLLKESIDISLKGLKYQDAADTYKLLYAVYDRLPDKDSSQKYLRAYTLLNDSIRDAQHVLLEKPLNNIIKNERLKHREQTKQLYTYISIVFIIALVAWIYSYKRMISRKKERERIFRQKDVEASSFREANQRLQQMTIDLQQKVNASFEELLSLAKSNHPNFYVRFQEVYPELHNKLLQTNPGLLNTELTLSAYIYLDFSTKEIAEYTFKSIKTIQNRKNSLRKRLDIDSSEDLYVWFKCL